MRWSSRERGQVAVATAASAVAVLVLSALTAVVLLRSPSLPVAAVTTVPTHSPAATTSAPAGPTASITGSPGPGRSVLTAAAPWDMPLGSTAAGHLQPGSHPDVLPADVLIADKLNNRLIVVDPQGRVRWEFPRPGDLAPGQTFHIPDDAFFTPDGSAVIATQEDDFVITLIDVATHRITYRYGVPGEPGLGANHLDNPDDALVLPNGDILTADIKNCRMLIIAPGAHVPLHVLGQTRNDCLHAPPARWGSPNGIFPMRNGHYLVTEINGSWVNEIGLDGTVAWSAHPQGIAYPSDTNEVSPDRYLTVDYSSPGQVEIFDHTGHAAWRFQGSGRNTLDHPSLALPLPNGDVLVNDDFNHRVVVIDPRTSAIVWQYGVTGVAGRAPGYLNNPDGLDLVPPNSFMGTHATTAGLWPPSTG